VVRLRIDNDIHLVEGATQQDCLHWPCNSLS
jgi:hypothetical protein